MKIGDRIKLKYARDIAGTVSQVYPDGSFRVTYDSLVSADGKVARGGTFTYQVRQRTDFMTP